MKQYIINHIYTSGMLQRKETLIFQDRSPNIPNVEKTKALKKNCILIRPTNVTKELIAQSLSSMIFYLYHFKKMALSIIWNNYILNKERKKVVFFLLNPHNTLSIPITTFAISQVSFHYLSQGLACDMCSLSIQLPKGFIFVFPAPSTLTLPITKVLSV